MDPDAKLLLWDLVSAARSVPRSQRGGFLALQTFGGASISHPGLPGGQIEDYDEGDLRDLIEAGLIRVTQQGRGDQEFELRPTAFAAYDEAHRDGAEPVAAQEQLAVEHVRSGVFTARYSAAFAKWRDADVLLWQDDSTRSLTTIGHLCREAMQLFATRLIELHNVQDAEPDPAKTINRLHSVIDVRRSAVGSRHVGLLEALVAYWRAVNDIVQRQEHGEQKSGGELTWDDGQRVVLYTALVMGECDRILS